MYELEKYMFLLCFHTWFLISPKLRLDLLRQLDKHWQFSLDNVRLTLKWIKQPFEVKMKDVAFHQTSLVPFHEQTIAANKKWQLHH